MDISPNTGKANDDSAFETHKSLSSSLKIGDKVESRYRDGTKWFHGSIQTVNKDGTYDILYDDGDKEKSVPEDRLRRLSVPQKETTTDAGGGSTGADLWIDDFDVGDGDNAGMAPPSSDLPAYGYIETPSNKQTPSGTAHRSSAYEADIPEDSGEDDDDLPAYGYVTGGEQGASSSSFPVPAPADPDSLHDKNKKGVSGKKALEEDNHDDEEEEEDPYAGDASYDEDFDD